MTLTLPLLRWRFLWSILPLRFPRFSLSFSLLFFRFFQSFRKFWINVFKAVCVIHRAPHTYCTSKWIAYFGNGAITASAFQATFSDSTWAQTFRNLLLNPGTAISC